MSKQKTYYKSSELPHVFAHQSAPLGRCPGHESFDGNTYFSYATPIARLVKGKAKLKHADAPQAVILNITSYSTSTARHQSGVRHAVSHIEPRFYVGNLRRGYSCGLPEDGESLVRHYLEEFERVREQYYADTGKVEPVRLSRYAHIRAREFLAKVSHLENAVKAAEFFGLPAKALKNKLAKLQPEIEVANSAIEAYDNKKQELARKREKAQRDASKATARKWLADDSDERTFSQLSLLDDDPELCAAVEKKNERLSVTEIERWKAGGSEPISHHYGLPVFLRRDDNELETSKGARVPIDHAKLAFEFVTKCRKLHHAYHRNGKTIHVGAYALDEVTAEGNVIAGCHNIQWAEIEDFAKREGWIQDSTPEAQNQPVPTGDADKGSQPVAS